MALDMTDRTSYAPGAAEAAPGAFLVQSEAPAGAGLVTSAISGEAPLDVEALLSIWEAEARGSLRFPSADGVASAANAFPVATSGARLGFQRLSDSYTGDVWRLVDGVYPHIDVAPGLVRFSRAAPRRTELTNEARRQSELRAPLGALDDDRLIPQSDFDRAHGVQLGGLWVGPLTRELSEATDDARAAAARGVITEWSSKSRANMRATMLSLDLAPITADDDRTPAMLTLTAPGDWLSVFPDAESAARAFHNFNRAWRDTFDAPLACIWKREFQRRGAPHWHLWTVLPFRDDDAAGRAVFLEWLADTWARCMGLDRYEGPHLPDPADLRTFRLTGEAPAYWHPDWVGPRRPGDRRRHGGCCEACRSRLAGTGVDTAEGMRARDPRRLAAYFLKESGTGAGKAYQNRPPFEWGLQPAPDGHEGPANYVPTKVGRYWGVRQLEKAVAVADVEPTESYHLWRCLRGLRERQAGNWWITERGGVRYAVSEASTVLPVTESVGRGKRIRNRVRASAGWVASNDGPALARRLAGHLHRRTERDKVLRRVGAYITAVTSGPHRGPRPSREDLMAHRRILGVSITVYMTALRAYERTHDALRAAADAVDTRAADSWAGRRTA